MGLSLGQVQEWGRDMGGVGTQRKWVWTVQASWIWEIFKDKQT